VIILFLTRDLHLPTVIMETTFAVGDISSF
jgi:hypothetical protein